MKLIAWLFFFPPEMAALFTYLFLTMPCGIQDGSLARNLTQASTMKVP